MEKNKNPRMIKIIVLLILVVVLVLLVIIFKDQIESMISSLFNEMCGPSGPQKNISLD